MTTRQIATSKGICVIPMPETEQEAMEILGFKTPLELWREAVYHFHMWNTVPKFTHGASERKPRAKA